MLDDEGDENLLGMGNFTFEQEKIMNHDQKLIDAIGLPYGPRRQVTRKRQRAQDAETLRQHRLKFFPNFLLAYNSGSERALEHYFAHWCKPDIIFREQYVHFVYDTLIYREIQSSRLLFQFYRIVMNCCPDSMFSNMRQVLKTRPDGSAYAVARLKFLGKYTFRMLMTNCSIKVKQFLTQANAMRAVFDNDRLLNRQYFRAFLRESHIRSREHVFLTSFPPVYHTLPLIYDSSKGCLVVVNSPDSYQRLLNNYHTAEWRPPMNLFPKTALVNDVFSPLSILPPSDDNGLSFTSNTWISTPPTASADEDQVFKDICAALTAYHEEFDSSGTEDLDDILADDIVDQPTLDEENAASDGIVDAPHKRIKLNAHGLRSSNIEDIRPRDLSHESEKSDRTSFDSSGGLEDFPWPATQDVEQTPWDKAVDNALYVPSAYDIPPMQADSAVGDAHGYASVSSSSSVSGNDHSVDNDDFQQIASLGNEGCSESSSSNSSIVPQENEQDFRLRQAQQNLGTADYVRVASPFSQFFKLEQFSRSMNFDLEITLIAYFQPGSDQPHRLDNYKRDMSDRYAHC